MFRFTVAINQILSTHLKRSTSKYHKKSKGKTHIIFSYNHTFVRKKQKTGYCLFCLFKLIHGIITYKRLVKFSNPSLEKYATAPTKKGKMQRLNIKVPFTVQNRGYGFQINSTRYIKQMVWIQTMTPNPHFIEYQLHSERGHLNQLPQFQPESARNLEAVIVILQKQHLIRNFAS